MADDVLRQVPTFSLFRRSSSLSSHPTAQGVSLRGIGPSGVSRTLVLVDGVPFNDPFGGWVYWTRVPLESVDRIEVIDGSSSSLYGNYGMGGVINIIPTRAGAANAASSRRSTATTTARRQTSSPATSGASSGVAVEGSAFDTDGFPIVAAAERGLIDNNAAVNFENFNGKVDYRANDRVNLFVRGGYFTEDRVNGKIGEVNDTKWTSVAGGVARQDAGPERSAGDGLRRRQHVPQHVPGGDGAERDGRLAEHRPPGDRPDGADHGRRHDGAVVEAHRPEELLQHRLRLAARGRRQPRGRLHRDAGRADRASDGAGDALAPAQFRRNAEQHAASSCRT